MKPNRRTISDTQLETEIIKQFQKGNSAKTDLYGLLRTKFKLGRDRYFKLYDVAYNKWQIQKEKAEADQMYENGKECLKSGLKSKIEREAELEKKIDELNKIIEIGTTKDYYIHNGKARTYNRDISILEKTRTVNEIRQLNAELSKMRGDYAPDKHEHSGSVGVKEARFE